MGKREGSFGCFGAVGVVAIALAIVVVLVRAAGSGLSDRPPSSSASASASAPAPLPPLSSAEARTKWPEQLKTARELVASADESIAEGKLIPADDVLSAVQDGLRPFAPTMSGDKSFADMSSIVDAKRKALAAQVQPMRAQASADASARGDMPSISDGAVEAVEHYLLRHANDPDSLRMAGCTLPDPSGAFWKTTCSYRGKNGYGAVVLNQGTFYVQHDTVVRMDGAQ